eukprot:2034050-Pleurochrysis_carterae.AAC.6
MKVSTPQWMIGAKCLLAKAHQCSSIWLRFSHAKGFSGLWASSTASLMCIMSYQCRGQCDASGHNNLTYINSFLGMIRNSKLRRRLLTAKQAAERNRSAYQ